MSKKELLAEFANTEGLSHYDEDIPVVSDTMKGMVTNGLHAQAQILVGVTDQVGELGWWVLRELESRRLISLPPFLPQGTSRQ